MFMILDMFLTEMCVQLILKLHRVWTAQAHLYMDFLPISVFKNYRDLQQFEKLADDLHSLEIFKN